MRSGMSWGFSLMTPDTAAGWQLRVLGVEQTLVAAAGQPLLAVLTDAGLPVRHACRNGVCEICEARLLHGKVVQGWPQARLEATEEAPLIRLCTAQAVSDLELELMPWAWRR